MPLLFGNTAASGAGYRGQSSALFATSGSQIVADFPQATNGLYWMNIGDGRGVTQYNVDFTTPDGTCIRDYVHVEDISRAHSLAIYHDVPSGVYNLGSNNGTSNREIIAAAERITGKKLKVVMGEARPGDPAVLTASAAKFGMVGEEWRQFELDDMIQHAWNWYVRKDS
jgi:UDP-glucose 4-epimerase